jgi:hypothetical protein
VNDKTTVSGVRYVVGVFKSRWVADDGREMPACKYVITRNDELIREFGPYPSAEVARACGERWLKEAQVLLDAVDAMAADLVPPVGIESLKKRLAHVHDCRCNGATHFRGEPECVFVVEGGKIRRREEVAAVRKYVNSGYPSGLGPKRPVEEKLDAIAKRYGWALMYHGDDTTEANVTYMGITIACLGVGSTIEDAKAWIRSKGDTRATPATHYVLPGVVDGLSKSGFRVESRQWFTKHGGFDQAWGRQWVPVIAADVDDALRIVYRLLPRMNSGAPTEPPVECGTQSERTSAKATNFNPLFVQVQRASQPGIADELMMPSIDFHKAERDAYNHVQQGIAVHRILEKWLREPGGMTREKFLAYCDQQKIQLSPKKVDELREKWLAAFPEVAKWFNFVHDFVYAETDYLDGDYQCTVKSVTPGPGGSVRIELGDIKPKTRGGCVCSAFDTHESEHTPACDNHRTATETQTPVTTSDGRSVTTMVQCDGYKGTPHEASKVFDMHKHGHGWLCGKCCGALGLSPTIKEQG